MADQSLTITLKGESRQAIEAIRATSAAMGQMIGVTVEGNQRIERSHASLTARLRATASSMEAVANASRMMLPALLAIGGAAGVVAREGLGMNDALLRANSSFELLLGSTAEATSLIKDLQKEAANTKATFSELLPIGQQLAAAFGEGSRNEIMRTVRAFSDVQKAVGASNDSMRLALLGFRQLVTSEKVQLEDLKQISENLPGLDTRSILKGAFGTSDTEALSNAGRSGREVADALLKGMEDRFKDARLHLPKDMEENLGNLRQGFQEVAGKLTTDLGPAITSAIKDISTALTELGKDPKALEALKAGFSDVAKGIRDAGRAAAEAIRWFRELSPEQQKLVVDIGKTAVTWTAWAVAIGSIAGVLGKVADALAKIGSAPAFKALLDWGGKAGGALGNLLRHGAANAAEGLAAPITAGGVATGAVAAPMMLGMGAGIASLHPDTQKRLAAARAKNSAADSAALRASLAQTFGLNPAEAGTDLETLAKQWGITPTPPTKTKPKGVMGPPAPTWPGLNLGSDLTELRKQDWYKEVDAMMRKAGVSTFAWEQNMLRESRGKPAIQPNGGGRGHWQFDFVGGLGKQLMLNGLSQKQALDIANDPIAATKQLLLMEKANIAKVAQEDDPYKQSLLFTKKVLRPAGYVVSGLNRTLGPLIGKPLPSQYAGIEAPEVEDAELRRRQVEDLAKKIKLREAMALPQGTAGDRVDRDIAILDTQEEMEKIAVQREFADAKINDAKRLNKALETVHRDHEQQRIKRLREFEKEQEEVRKSEMGKALAQLEVDLQQQERTLVEFGQTKEQIERAQAEFRAKRLGDLAQTLGPKLPPAMREELEHKAFEAQQRLKGLGEREKAEKAREYLDALGEQFRQIEAQEKALEETARVYEGIEKTKRAISEQEFQNALSAAEATGHYGEQIVLLDQQIAKRTQEREALGQSLSDQQKAVELEGKIGELTERRAKAIQAINDDLEKATKLYDEAQKKADEADKRFNREIEQRKNRFADQARDGQKALDRQQAEMGGPGALADYLEKQLSELDGQIDFTRVWAQMFPEGAAALPKMLFDRNNLAQELEKLRPTWKTFWKDMAADAAAQLKSIGANAISGTIESLLGGENKLSDVFKNLINDLRGMLAQSISKSVVEWISDGVGGMFGGGRSKNGAPSAARTTPTETLPDGFVGPPAPLQQQGKKASHNMAVAGVQLAAGIMGIVDVFRKGKKDLASTILQVVSSIVSIISAIPGGWGGIGRILGFADGGDPPVGVPSMVGERGPELFIPRVPGTIIPNHRLNIGMPRMQDVRQLMGDGRGIPGMAGNGRLEGMLEKLFGMIEAGKLGGQTINQNIGQVRSADDLTHSYKELGWMLRQSMRTAPTR